MRRPPSGRSTPGWNTQEHSPTSARDDNRLQSALRDREEEAEHLRSQARGEREERRESRE